jgi:hypothetical protein
MKKIVILFVLFFVVVLHGFAQNIPVGIIDFGRSLLGSTVPREFTRPADDGFLYNGGNIYVLPDSNRIVSIVEFRYEFVVDGLAANQIGLFSTHLENNGWKYVGSREPAAHINQMGFSGNGIFIIIHGSFLSDRTEVSIVMQME